MNDNKNIALDEMNFIYEIKQIVTEARQKAYSAINSAMVEAYWFMDKHKQVKERRNGRICKCCCRRNGWR